MGDIHGSQQINVGHREVKIETRVQKEKKRENRRRATDFFNVLFIPVGSLGIPVSAVPLPIFVPRLSTLRSLLYPEDLGASSSGTSVNSYQTVRAPEESNPHSHLYLAHAGNTPS
jgi:hypothetical protein